MPSLSIQNSCSARCVVLTGAVVDLLRRRTPAVASLLDRTLLRGA